MAKILYPRRLKRTVETQPFSIKGANIRLWCDVYYPEDSRKDIYLVFWMRNDFNSSQSCSIDTIYVYNAGDVQITELGALLDHKWKIPLKGARTGDSAKFISTLKSGIVRATETTGIKNLDEMINLALDCCQTELIYMDALGKYFKVGTPSKFGSWVKNLVSDHASTSIGSKINKVISASETVENLAPGNQFIFAAARYNPHSDTIEFTDDLTQVFGSRDSKEFDNLLLSETAFLNKSAVIDEQTKEKKYNQLYTAATDLLKYNLIKQGITTAGEVGKAAMT